MAYPTSETSTVHEFAQTRGVDDLFDDEIIPVSEEQQSQPVTEPREDVREKPADDVEPPRGDSPRQSRGSERARGRGRGKGRGGRRLPQSKPKHPDIDLWDKLTEGTTEEEAREASEDKDAGGAEESNEGSSAPVSRSESETARVPAVRGDRSATGGIRKPKLTEEELTRRIATAKQNAAKVAAAHARAEADQASFLEREKIAEEKKRQESLNHRVMVDERERNRQRKLGALGGRAWDVDKQEEDYNPRGNGSRFRRGVHGAVSGYARRDFLDSNGRSTDETWPDDHNHSHYRGGARGGRSGRNRGGPRGPRGESPSSNKTSTKPAPAPSESPKPVPATKDEAEFPALPESTSNKEETLDEAWNAAWTADTASRPSTPGANTWAERVEDTNEAGISAENNNAAWSIEEEWSSTPPANTWAEQVEDSSK